MKIVLFSIVFFWPLIDFCICLLKTFFSFIQKWSKGKSRDKNQNKVQFEEELYTRFLAEVPKMKLITPSALVERLKINGSLARAAIKELENDEQIKRVSYHHSQWIYTRSTKEE